MTFQSDAVRMTPEQRRDFGFARVRDVAFDAIQVLWRKRRAAGMRQTDIANAIKRHPTWVSRSLRAPGNWTLRTIGELAEALNGEVEIIVYPMEDATPVRRNYSAYDEYERPPKGQSPSSASPEGNQVKEGKPQPRGFDPAQAAAA
jgi:hypothetical protein